MKVFISSTSDDLKVYRLAAADVARDAQWEPIGMEHLPADPRSLVQFCRETIDGCGLVVLLQAWRSGWVPAGGEGGDDKTSITGIEIEHAKARKKDVLAFLADDYWPVLLCDEDAAARMWTKNFRVGLNRHAKFFKWEDDPKLPLFRALLRQEFAIHRNRGLVSQPLPPLPAVKLLMPQDTLLPPEPYPLLAPYEHPRTFAGRDNEVTSLAALVSHPALVLCVHAASGVGKSSLLLAGLAPRLRSEGYSVSIDRAPGNPRLAQRLLKDILEPADAIQLGDEDADLPATFARWLAQAHEMSRKRIVLVLDQVDDVLRNERRRDEALARLGPLMAATAERLPGVQGFACKWILCYRHEFHGQVRAWLEDVIAPAAALNRSGLESLPSDLSDSQRYHDWVLPVMGKPRPGDRGLEESKRAFRRAILQPLEQTENGRPCYSFLMPSDAAERLATVFAQYRQSQPDAPLVPELQVVLGHLLQQARDWTSNSDLGESIFVQTPSDEQLELEIRRALAQHVERVLNSAFPLDGEAAGRSARTRALVALTLSRLADAEGRRGEGLPEEDVIRMMGPEGRKVLARLSAADTRLVVVLDGRCSLSHDRLAEVVAEIVRNEASRSDFLPGLRSLQQTIDHKLALYQSHAGDESALSLTREQRELINGNLDTLLFDEPRRVWWAAAATYRRRFDSYKVRSLAGATIVLLLGVGVFLIRERYVSQDTNGTFSLPPERQGIAAGPHRVDFEGLLRLARQLDSDWGQIPNLLDPEFLEQIDGDVFASVSMERTQHLFEVVERSHRLFVRSRSLFGAMSFALEEVRRRSSEVAAQERARRLSEAARRAFISYHKERTADFQEPPAHAADDPLNAWINLEPGEFVMGSDDGDDVERPKHRVTVSGFSMQQHEVTNEEYRRFDPGHKFPAGHERHAVANVSWYEAAAYAAWLGASLPSEAEWEYAAAGTGTHGRSGKSREYPWGDSVPTPERAVFSNNFGDRTSTLPVEPSRVLGRTPEGIDDMAGNLFEWCRDVFGPYEVRNAVNPLGPIDEGGKTGLRVFRGGSFDGAEYVQRTAYRGRGDAASRVESLGFRLVSSRLRP